MFAKALWFLIPIGAYLLGQRNARAEGTETMVTARSGEQWKLLGKGVTTDQLDQALKNHIQSSHVEGSYLVVTFSKDFTFIPGGTLIQTATKVRDA